MSEKSHVSMGQHKCPVCCEDYDSGEILMETRIDTDRRTGERKLRQSLDRFTVTGWGDLCPKCMKLHEDGFVALVAIDEDQSTMKLNGRYTPEGAYRTGNVAHLKREAASRLFNVDITDQKFVFVQDEVIDMLKVAAQ